MLAPIQYVSRLDGRSKTYFVESNEQPTSLDSGRLFNMDMMEIQYVRLSHGVIRLVHSGEVLVVDTEWSRR